MKNNSNIFLVSTLIFLIISMASFSNYPKKMDCDDVKSYGDEAYNYFRKAYRSSNLDDIHYYAKKGMNAASSAESEADDSDCDCDDAESAASDAYSQGRKAYNSDDFEDAQSYARKAMNAASEIISEADDCE